MLRVIIPIVIALAIIVGCVIYLNTDFTLNKGENDVTYNGVVYEKKYRASCKKPEIANRAFLY